MVSDDLTREFDVDGDKETQPTLTSLLELVRDVKRGVDANNIRLERVEATLGGRIDRVETTLAGTTARIDRVDGRVEALSARLDESVSRLTRDIEGVNTRIVELSADMNTRFSEIDIRSMPLTEEDSRPKRTTTTCFTESPTWNLELPN